MTRISCNDKLWKNLLEKALSEDRDVVLINLDYEEDGDYCERLAQEQKMTFGVDSETGYGIFYKKPAAGVAKP